MREVCRVVRLALFLMGILLAGTQEDEVHMALVRIAFRMTDHIEFREVTLVREKGDPLR